MEGAYYAAAYDTKLRQCLLWKTHNCTSWSIASTDFSFCANNSPELYATPKPCDGCPAGPPAAEYSYVAKQCTGLTDGYAFGKMVGENDNQQFVLTPATASASAPTLAEGEEEMHHPLADARTGGSVGTLENAGDINDSGSDDAVNIGGVPVTQLFEVGKRDQWVDGRSAWTESMYDPVHHRRIMFGWTPPGVSPGYVEKGGNRKTLPTENLLKDTAGLLRPPIGTLEGGGGRITPTAPPRVR